MSMTALRLAIILALCLVAARNAIASGLVADLSEHEIKISTDFAGDELLLFGVADGKGDIIVIVSGPDAAAIVRKKSRVSGVWINTESVQFETVPGFYHVSATPGLSASDLDEVLRENGVGFRYLNVSTDSQIDPERSAVFREALLRRKEALGLYTPKTGTIDIVGGSLFRTRVQFPAIVPTGKYRVDVYHVEDGWVKSTTSIPLKVGKVGVEATIFQFAHDHPALYGILAIVVAAMAGYGAGMLFGRR